MNLKQGVVGLLVFVLLYAIVWVVINVGFAEAIPLDALTRTRIGLTENRIRDYYATKGSFPKRLADLPATGPDRDDSIVDGWGRPIQYRIEGGRVVLTSLGRDGRPGGSGKDSDITVSFSVKPREPQTQPTTGVR